MKKRFTEERIIGSIKEHESGVETGDICRRLPNDGVLSGAFRNLAQSAPVLRSMRRNG